MEKKRMQHMSICDRSVIDENHRAILRRWQLSQSFDWMTNDTFDTQFPDQRNLFRLLSRINESKAASIANCPVPLFIVQTEIDLQAKSHNLKQELPGGRCSATFTEVFLALMSRLDALRIDPASADVVFGMPAHQRKMIYCSTPSELHSIAHFPAVLLKPAVRDEYFLHAISRNYTTAHRHTLAVTTRRSNPNPFSRLRHFSAAGTAH